jgi:hypothetical protein
VRLLDAAAGGVGLLGHLLGDGFAGLLRSSCFSRGLLSSGHGVQQIKLSGVLNRPF